VRRLASTITAELPDERLVLAAARFKALTGDPDPLALRGQIEVVDLRAEVA